MELPDFFLMNSILLGIGLAADAFSVSVVNGLNEPQLHPFKAAKIAFVFAFFQALMPLTGWMLTNYMLQYFTALQKLIPFISFILLSFLGSKLILESLKNENICNTSTGINGLGLIVQGLATSLDALTIGFTIAEYSPEHALLCSLIIAAVTFILCHIGVMIGKTVGCKLSGKAEILGGIILISIGVEIFIKSLIS